jgi:hypothetical protein
MLDADELRCLMCAVVVVEVILWFLYHQGVPVDPNEFVKFTQRLEAHPMLHEVGGT